MQREFLEAQGLTGEVIDVILAEHDKTVRHWQEQLAQADNARFDGMLDSVITAARGRSTKAITALLDVEAIRASEDPKAAAEAALTELKKHSAYLFDAPTPPPYAARTGAGGPERPAPQTLAGALKEKFQR